MKIFAGAEIKLSGIGFIRCWGWEFHAFFFARFHYMKFVSSCL